MKLFSSRRRVAETAPRPFLDERVAQAVRELELTARRHLAALLSGNYRSVFRGSGMQFKEFRHYEPGDDIRHISWTATARTGRATLKVFDEERELDVLLLIDVSGSAMLHTPSAGNRRKIDAYGDIAALIGLAAMKSGDNVGCLLFSDQTESYQPPRRTRGHVLSLLTRLLSQPLQTKRSDLREPLRYAEKVLSSRSLVLVLSDFLAPDFSEPLLQLARRHEIILLHAVTRAEEGVGLDGVYEVCDPETGEFFLLDGNSLLTRERLGLYQAELRHRLEEMARRGRADYLRLPIDEDYLHELVRYFRRRGPSRL